MKRQTKFTSSANNPCICGGQDLSWSACLASCDSAVRHSFEMGLEPPGSARDSKRNRSPLPTMMLGLAVLSAAGCGAPSKQAAFNNVSAGQVRSDVVSAMGREPDSAAVSDYLGLRHEELTWSDEQYAYHVTLLGTALTDERVIGKTSLPLSK